jgi:hypothetical protein
MRWRAFSSISSAERLFGMDHDGVDHHAALEALHLADLLGLLGDGHVLVDDADAAALGHRHRHAGLVTVSIAAAISGMCRLISRVRRVRVSAWAGRMVE